VEALNSENATRKRAAIETLGDLQSWAINAEPALRKCLEDENEVIRESAAQALERMQPNGK